MKKFLFLSMMLLASNSHALLIVNNTFNSSNDAETTFNNSGLNGVTVSSSVTGSFANTYQRVYNGNIANTIFGFTGNQLLAGATVTTLNLSNIGTHTNLDLGFLLSANDMLMAHNANMQVEVDGTTVFNNKFATNAGSTAGFYSSSNSSFLGIGNYDNYGGGSDIAFDMGLESSLQNIIHSNSTAQIKITFTGNLGTSCCSPQFFMMDNFKISADAQPVEVNEPSSLFAILTSLGFLIVGTLFRRQLS